MFVVYIFLVWCVVFFDMLYNVCRVYTHKHKQIHIPTNTKTQMYSHAEGVEECVGNQVCWARAFSKYAHLYTHKHVCLKIKRFTRRALSVSVSRVLCLMSCLHSRVLLLFFPLFLSSVLCFSIYLNTCISLRPARVYARPRPGLCVRAATHKKNPSKPGDHPYPPPFCLTCERDTYRWHMGRWWRASTIFSVAMARRDIWPWWPSLSMPRVLARRSWRWWHRSVRPSISW